MNGVRKRCWEERRGDERELTQEGETEVEKEGKDEMRAETDERR